MEDKVINIDYSSDDRVSLEVKRGVIEIYDDLLKTIWSKIMPTLGTVTLVTISERAIARTAKNHPSFGSLAVSEEGIQVSSSRDAFDADDKESLKNGFKELVTNLFDILAKLTGNILIGQLMREVESIEIREG